MGSHSSIFSMLLAGIHAYRLGVQFSTRDPHSHRVHTSRYLEFSISGCHYLQHQSSILEESTNFRWKSVNTHAYES